MVMYFTGSTIKFTAEFYNWDDTLIDPTTVEFTIYDSTFKAVSTHTVTLSNRVSLGVYYWLWVPTVTGTFIYQWKGVIGGNPNIRRKTFQVVNV